MSAGAPAVAPLVAAATNHDSGEEKQSSSAESKSFAPPAAAANHVQLLDMPIEKAISNNYPAQFVEILRQTMTFKYREFVNFRLQRLLAFYQHQEPLRIKKIPKVTPTDMRLFLATLDMESHDHIEYICAIPQRTPEWFFWRMWRLTGSKAGEAAGETDEKRDKVLKEALWSTFKGNAATERGERVEPFAFGIADVWFTQYYKKRGAEKVWLEDTGLLVDAQNPWLAVSSDGLLYVVWPDGTVEIITIEIKAPQPDQFYAQTLRKHKVQFSAASEVIKTTCAWYVVWTTMATQFKLYTDTRQAWRDNYYPKVKRWYMEDYVPRLILKERGVLQFGEIDVSPTVMIASRFTTKKPIVSAVNQQSAPQQQ